MTEEQATKLFQERRDLMLEIMGGYQDEIGQLLQDEIATCQRVHLETQEAN